MKLRNVAVVRLKVVVVRLKVAVKQRIVYAILRESWKVSNAPLVLLTHSKPSCFI